MENYLGYEPNSREEKETTNRRNGYFDKTLKRDVSDIENKVLALYARDMSQRDISATIDDIVGGSQDYVHDQRHCGCQF